MISFLWSWCYRQVWYSQAHIPPKIHHMSRVGRLRQYVIKKQECFTPTHNFQLKLGIASKPRFECLNKIGRFETETMVVGKKCFICFKERNLARKILRYSGFLICAASQLHIVSDATSHVWWPHIKRCHGNVSPSVPSERRASADNWQGT